MTSDTPLEEIIKELQRLAKLKPLKGEQQAEARQLMSELKRRSFTNAEISRLTNGLLEESTIKQTYTRGVVAVDSADKDRAIDLLAELSGRDMTLDDVEEFLPVKADLDDRGVTFDEVGSLIQMARESDVPLEELVQKVKEMKASDLSISKMKEALQVIHDVEVLGWSMENLHAVMDAAKTHGKPEEVLKAVTTYNSVTEIETKLQELNLEREKQEKTVGELGTKNTELKARMDEAEGTLALVARLNSEGIDEPALKNLVDLSAKHGGVKGVTEAVKSYATLADIQIKIKEAKKQYSDAEAQLKQVQADLAHLMPVKKMVETLLYDLGFTVKAVTDLFKAAKAYGIPVEVLEALGKYGNLTALQKDINFLEGYKAQLEARIGVLQSNVHSLEGKTEELTHALTELLAPITKEVTKAVVMITTEVKEYAEKFGGLKKEAEQLDIEVKFARVILSTEQFPEEAKGIPLWFGLRLLDGLLKFCLVNGVNPKSVAGDKLWKKYEIFPTKELELLDVLYWAENVLRGQLGTRP